MNHSFDIEIAEKYGVNEAIFIENMKFWIAKNQANGRHFYEGRYWTYNSAKAYEELFPYWTAKQIRRIIDWLVKYGVLLKGNFNQSAYDRTLWYTFATQDHLPKSGNGKPENAKSLIDTDINTDISPATAKASADNAASFDRFWKAYPRKAGKGDARKAYAKLKITAAFEKKILDAIGDHQKSDQWIDAKFIPYPATWIRDERWDDEESTTGQQNNPFAGGI